mmetsp:Transcript_100591/g.224787  ORF Transcript_100591/g.224787 Transcript_100591/m.224787 type:complete len:529 (-) Transcript_100591:608-2194(-)
MPEAEHTEIHLGATLVIAYRELEEVHTHEEGVLWILCHSKDVLHVILHRMMDVVVLSNEDGYLNAVGPEAAAHVLVQELVLDRGGRVRCVEAVHEALHVGLLNVILRGVVRRPPLDILHAAVEFRHLPQARRSAVYSEGHGGGERDRIACNAQVLLGLQHAVQGGDEGSAHQGPCPHQLEVWLVHDDHGLEGRVVCRAVLDSKAVLQVPTVGPVGLVEAIVLIQRAPVRRLRKPVVAHSDDNVQARLESLIEEGSLHHGRIVAVHPDGVGTHVPHNLEVSPSPRSPLHCRRIAHEVIVFQPDVALQGRWAVGDALDEILCGATVGCVGGDGIVHRAGPIGAVRRVGLVNLLLEFLEARVGLHQGIPFRVREDAVGHRPLHAFVASFARHRGVALLLRRWHRCAWRRAFAGWVLVQHSLESLERGGGVDARVPLGVRMDAIAHRPLHGRIALLEDLGRVASFRLHSTRLGTEGRVPLVQQILEVLQARGSVEIWVPLRVLMDALRHCEDNGIIAKLSAHCGAAGIGRRS